MAEPFATTRLRPCRRARADIDQGLRSLYAQGLQSDGAWSRHHRHRRLGRFPARRHRRRTADRFRHADLCQRLPLGGHAGAARHCVLPVVQDPVDERGCGADHLLGLCGPGRPVAVDRSSWSTPAHSITQTFFVTAAAFGALSLYGYTTKRDLSALGSFLIMGVVGLIIAMVVNIFLQSSALGSPSRRSAC